MSMRPDGRPPFRADHVGSLLRPLALRQAFRRRAGNDIGEKEFTRIQDDCVRDAVRMQEETGLEVVTDGEFRRGSYWGRFVERTEGLEVRAALLKFRDDHGHEVDFTAPYATAPLRRTHPLALDEFVFLRDAATVTAKITLPAPSTMHFLRFADFAERSAYADVDSFFADLVEVFVQEIADLVPGVSARGLRIAHPDDWYFQGHFPDDPVVPAIVPSVSIKACERKSSGCFSHTCCRVALMASISVNKES